MCIVHLVRGLFAALNPYRSTPNQVTLALYKVLSRKLIGSTFDQALFLLTHISEAEVSPVSSISLTRSPLQPL